MTEFAHLSNSASPHKIGLIAGWGRFPLVVAQTLRSQGKQVFCLGVKDHVDSELISLCHHFQPIGIAQLGKAVRYFQKNGVTQATMAGKIHKVLLFKKYYLLKHLPDWYCIQTFYPHFVSRTKDRKDDTMLGTIVDAFAKFGIQFAPATDFAPELLVKERQLAGAPLTGAQIKDVEFGWMLASEMGRLDVGQSVAVKGQAVLAVEAIEGTDQCIVRAGQLCQAGGLCQPFDVGIGAATHVGGRLCQRCDGVHSFSSSASGRRLRRRRRHGLLRLALAMGTGRGEDHCGRSSKTDNAI